MSVIGILFKKRIVDDSGFPRTPDRPVELLGTRERYPRSVKTMIGARGPDFLGGSATMLGLCSIYWIFSYVSKVLLKVLIIGSSCRLRPSRVLHPIELQNKHLQIL